MEDPEEADHDRAPRIWRSPRMTVRPTQRRTTPRPGRGRSTASDGERDRAKPPEPDAKTLRSECQTSWEKPEVLRPIGQIVALDRGYPPV